MWRFMLISFAFLGFAFYELSGGADYRPAENSLQVAMRNTSIFAPPRPVAPDTLMAEAVPAPDAPARNASEPEAGTAAATRPNARKPNARNVSTSGLDRDAHGGFEISLASTARPLTGGQPMEARSAQPSMQQVGQDFGTFSAETLVRDVSDRPIEEAVALNPAPADIRQIKVDRANMRSGPGTDFSALGQLTAGARIEVLQQRGAWVELRDLQTGQTGWMAGWLVASTN